ncbi:MAG: hypothetical protein CFK49_05810 [Armatimonadetes bacterium JP3_11]|nr:MAG: hypothetical protein CFK49_05810 [Armatimonadetes bacterium JP3_11]
MKRLTTEIGYNGGPFYSWDGKFIVYRAYHPQTDEEIKEFQDLLRKRLVRPSKLELWVMTADGRRKQKISNLGQANFAPFMHPSNRKIIFSSNHHDPRGREFDLFLINRDGTGVEQITYTGDFDGFPMFSRDGKKLVWASNRTAKARGETNIYIADWVE